VFESARDNLINGDETIPLECIHAMRGLLLDKTFQSAILKSQRQVLEHTADNLDL
jgi:hypothetical protein